MYELDYDAKMPLYEQLYLRIKEAVECGKLLPDEKLPSKRALSKILKISQITVENAYEQLKAEGYIYSIEKRGYFVQAISPRYSPLPVSKEVPALPEDAGAEKIRYDLRGERTDIENFPFSVWSKLTRQVLSEQRQTLLQRTPNRGIEELRREIAIYLEKYRGIRTGSKNIIIGAGTEYMLGLLSQLLPSAKFAFENPGYKKAARVLSANGADVCFVPMDEHAINIEKLEKSSANVVYATPAHHFPLGTVMPIKRRNELLSIMQKKENGFIIEDDYNSEFRFSGRPIPTLYGIDSADRVIYLGTFTQSLCPSLRISYMILPDELNNRYESELSFYSSTVPSFEQYTLLKFIQGGYFERHLNRMRNIYKSRREELISSLKSSDFGSEITVLGNNAGLSLLIKFEGRSEDELVKSALQNGVCISGLSRYYSNGVKPPESTVILGYSALQKGDMENVVNLLRKSWK